MSFRRIDNTHVQDAIDHSVVQIKDDAEDTGGARGGGVSKFSPGEGAAPKLTLDMRADPDYTSDCGLIYFERNCPARVAWHQRDHMPIIYCRSLPVSSYSLLEGGGQICETSTDLPRDDQGSCVQNHSTHLSMHVSHHHVRAGRSGCRRVRVVGAAPMGPVWNYCRKLIK